MRVAALVGNGIEAGMLPDLADHALGLPIESPSCMAWLLQHTWSSSALLPTSPADLPYDTAP